MITVLAVDQDANDIITYQLVNSTSNGTEYFYLDRDTGAITLRRSLQGTFINAYTVRRQEKQSALYILCKNELQHTECSDLNIILQLTVRATDNRIRSALATVRIFITRQINQPPVFVNTPYETTIESSRQINSTVYTVTAVDSDLQVCCLSKLCTLFIKLFHRNQINYVTFGLKKISLYKCVFLPGHYSLWSDWILPSHRLFHTELFQWPNQSDKIRVKWPVLISTLCGKISNCYWVQGKPVIISISRIKIHINMHYCLSLQSFHCHMFKIRNTCTWILKFWICSCVLLHMTLWTPLAGQRPMFS